MSVPENPSRRASDGPLEVKTFGAFEIKNVEQGEVCAVVCTLGVVDKDGDVLLPGSFPDSATVKMSGYGHDVILGGAAPVGKGTIAVEGDKAIFTGKFFMSSDRAREAFNIVKELGADGEWSFGFPRGNVVTEKMTDEWKSKGARRLISKLQPIEASPVFVGAGHGTGTLYTKAKEEEIVPDPAIEAKRLDDERKEKEKSATNSHLERRFSRLPR